MDRRHFSALLRGNRSQSGRVELYVSHGGATWTTPHHGMDRQWLLGGSHSGTPDPGAGRATGWRAEVNPGVPVRGHCWTARNLAHSSWCRSSHWSLFHRILPGTHFPHYNRAHVQTRLRSSFTQRHRIPCQSWKYGRGYLLVGSRQSDTGPWSLDSSAL